MTDGTLTYEHLPGWLQIVESTKQIQATTLENLQQQGQQMEKIEADFEKVRPQAPRTRGAATYVRLHHAFTLVCLREPTW